jgi:2-C-methyl-D-erythritol 2,4-cyclodiphosphate synthase
VIATGIGWDVHRFAPGRALVLGGVTVPGELGLVGHSDADVLTHAVIDALLGAAGLGDIGELFPDTAAQWKDAHSIDLLRHVDALLAQRGYAVVHVDATVMLERPQLGDRKAAMRERLAAALGLAVERVNVKATRGEGLGFVGRVEGAAALAIATVELPGVG